MNDLRILIARLGWPSTSARWWTMQELATRLGKPDVKTETEAALLELLGSRKLEAEVVEVLCIFWMAFQGFGYSPTAEITERFSKTSTLSNLLAANCGLPIQAIDAELREAPEDFEIPNDFEGVQGVDLPRIFRTTLGRLQGYTGFPFVRQMAFEWKENHEAYPEAPYQGDLWHFAQSRGKGLTSNLSARASLRAISAYLRTLSVAKQFWNMPTELANQESLLAMPIHPTFALLRPMPPGWFSPTNWDGDTETVESAVGSILNNLERTRPGDELIALSSPVMISMERCVEVSLVRWSQTAGGKVDDIDLAGHLDDYWKRVGVLPSTAKEPLSTTTTIKPPTFQQLVDKDCRAWPLAETIDFHRIGYLQRDLYPSRLYFPTMPGSLNVEITPHEGQLQVKAENQVVADFCYWNAGWGPARPTQFGGNCGTALISRGTTYRKDTAPECVPSRAFYFWQMRTLQRNNTFDEFSERLATGVIFV